MISCTEFIPLYSEFFKYPSIGKKSSKYYIEETRTVYAAIANECGCSFNLEYYDELGGTKFTFARAASGGII